MSIKLNYDWNVIDPIKAELMIYGMSAIQRYTLNEININISEKAASLIDSNPTIHCAVEEAKQHGVQFSVTAA